MDYVDRKADSGRRADEWNRHTQQVRAVPGREHGTRRDQQEHRKQRKGDALECRSAMLHRFAADLGRAPLEQLRCPIPNEQTERDGANLPENRGLLRVQPQIRQQPPDLVIGHNRRIVYRTMRLLLAALAFSALPAHGARPFVTDDARVVDPQGCQVETFYKRQREFHESEYWVPSRVQSMGTRRADAGGKLDRQHATGRQPHADRAGQDAGRSAGDQRRRLCVHARRGAGVAVPVRASRESVPKRNREFFISG
jgi:hypothetical protein